jgi:hypothetical protein
MVLNQRSILIGVAVILLIGATLIFRWQPDRQLNRRWEGFLEAFSTRRWSAVDTYLSPEYQDSWGHTRHDLKRQATYALRDFTRLEIRVESVATRRTGRSATIEAVVRISGSGGYRAESTRRAVNTVFPPTEFRWERQLWRPWDWRLVWADNPEIDLPGAYGMPFGP